MSTPLRAVACAAIVAGLLYLRVFYMHNYCGASPPAQLDPESINVQIIGDSISKGMMRNHKYTKEWRVFHSGRSVTGGCKNTEHGIKCLSHWIGNHIWDVIIFNFGLHDIGLDYEHVTLEKYVQNLEVITETLKRHARKLYWVTTTPVPSVPLEPPRTQCDVLRYNKAAEQAMERAGVPVIHLFSYNQRLCSNETYYSSCSGVQLDNNVHFTREGYSSMARYVGQHSMH